jgi:hypothetical protein
MTTKLWDQFWTEWLSQSSREALSWAFSRQSGAKGQTPAVTATDLLVGIWLSHENSEPQQLLTYLEVDLPHFYELLRAEGRFAPDQASEGPRSLTEMPPLAPEVERILEESLSLARQQLTTEAAPAQAQIAQSGANYPPEDQFFIRLKDLFGGLLVSSNSARDMLTRTLAGSPVSCEAVAASYPEFLTPPFAETTYTEFLVQRHPLFGLSLSGYHADVRTDDDWVGIGPEVNALAYLISATSLKPPLAIGLFGNWGSGKSFFMNALQKRIYKLTDDARKSGRSQKEISIYKSIVQIEFNAWHYVEGNLWASLVEHIFRHLKTRDKDDLSLLQQRQQVWIKKLDSARQAQKQIQARQIALIDQWCQNQWEISQLELERQMNLDHLKALKAADVLAAVQLSAEDQKKLNQLLGEVGISQSYEAATEFMAAIEHLQAELQHGNALLTPLRERGWKWALLLIGVILIGPLVSLGLSLVPSLDLPPLTNALTSVAAFLAGLTALLKQGTVWLSNSVRRVQEAQGLLDQKRREKEREYDQRIEALEHQNNDLQTQIEQVRQDDQTVTQQIEEVEQELQRITPSRLLFDFINERVGSDDYRKYLGVAALIRRDFEQLSELIIEQNKTFIETDTGQAETEVHLMNRIVLYIDDLDRCPHDKVIQVLQAVHLLLAFDLFVVVVAVDARWLSQSLQKHYQDLLTTSLQQSQGGLVEGLIQQATPQDYLEKIFQIPFWVRPLSETARLRIVQGLMAGSLIEETPQSVEDQSSHLPPPPPKDPNGSGAISPSTNGVEWIQTEWARPVQAEAQTDLTPASLKIKKEELAFIKAVQSLLGCSPRSVKRFVNLYWLVKSIAMSRSAHFVKEKAYADYKLVCFLLVILTGLPALSSHFFAALRRNPPLEAKDDPKTAATGNLKQLLETLKRELQDPATARVNPVSSNTEALEELARLESWVQQYEKGQWNQLETSQLADWAPQIARYSFRVEGMGGGDKGDYPK